MDVPAELLPVSWVWAAHALYLAMLALALRRAPWERLQRNDVLNLFLGACVGLAALWSLRAGISPGLNFHLLGVTVLTLAFGWELAIAGSALVLLIITLNGAAGWETFSVNALLMGVLPATLTLGLLRLAERWLPANFFVYVLVNAFLAAALSMAATTLAATAVLALSGVYPLEHLGYEYLPYLPLMVFPEGMINGFVIAMLVGLRPQWVSTFDEARYLEGR